MNDSTKTKIYRLIAVGIILVLWQIIAMIIGQEILLVSPVQVFLRLFTIWREQGFWSAVAFSSGRIISGFVLGFVCGILMALCAYRWEICETVFWPWTAAIKSIPVASFVVICLVWLSGRTLPVLIAFLIVLPIVYQNLLQGLKSLDPKMEEMCQIYEISHVNKLRYIIIPQLSPYIQAAAAITVGMAWKAAVAAEIIGTPNGSIGKMLYTSKIYLDTDDLFAWTVIIVLLSIVSEKIFLKLLSISLGILSGEKNIISAENAIIESEKDINKVTANIKTGGSDMHKDNAYAEDTSNNILHIEKLGKVYDSVSVIEDFDFTMAEGEHLAIMGASGCGKTTLLRLIAGLEMPDSGEVRNQLSPVSICFQEDRLCKQLSAIQNIMLFAKINNRKRIQEVLFGLGFSEEDMNKKLRSYSGGMKRRVALAVCVLKEAKLYLLDEPFNELDEASIKRACDFCNEYLHDKTLIVVTHSAEEAAAVATRTIFM